MNKKKMLIIVTVLMLGGNLAFAKAVTGVAIVNQTPGVRQLGMAEVFTGIADDASTLHYNPAGIATLKGLEFNAMYHQNIVDTQHEAINVVFPLNKAFIGNNANIGIGIYAYQGGTMEWNKLDENEQSISSNKVKAENDYQISLGYGERIISGIGRTSLGLIIKGVQSTLVEKYTAKAFAVDFGLLHKVKGLGLGLAIQNIGTDMKFIEEGDSLPFTIRAGGSYGVDLNNLVKMTIGIDAVNTKNDNMKYNVGAELWLGELGIRGGYKINDENKISIGASLKHKWFQLDYAYKIMDVFESTHQFALTLRQIVPKMNKETKLKKMKKYYMKAVSYYKKKMYREAIKEWKKVLRLAPNHKQSKQAIKKAQNKINTVARK